MPGKKDSRRRRARVSDEERRRVTIRDALRSDDESFTPYTDALAADARLRRAASDEWDFGASEPLP